MARTGWEIALIVVIALLVVILLIVYTVDVFLCMLFARQSKKKKTTDKNNNSTNTPATKRSDYQSITQNEQSATQIAPTLLKRNYDWNPGQRRSFLTHLEREGLQLRKVDDNMSPATMVAFKFIKQVAAMKKLRQNDPDDEEEYNEEEYKEEIVSKLSANVPEMSPQRNTKAITPLELLRQKDDYDGNLEDRYNDEQMLDEYWGPNYVPESLIYAEGEKEAIARHKREMEDLYKLQARAGLYVFGKEAADVVMIEGTKYAVSPGPEAPVQGKKSQNERKNGSGRERKSKKSKVMSTKSKLASKSTHNSQKK